MTGRTAAETARIYRTLGQLYLEPLDEERLSRVRGWAATWLEEAGGTLDEDIARPLRTIRDADPDRLEDLSAEFTRLFRGVSKRASPDPPYESLYTDGSIYGPTTTEVRNAYREKGLDIGGEDSREPPDHLGIELQFLGELREREPVDGEAVRDRQRQFVENHPGRWIGDLRSAVEDADPPRFYRALLELTEAILERERERLR